MFEEQQSLLKTRSQNLKRILENEYDNNKDEMAEKLEVKPGTLTKYLNPNSNKPCNDKAALRIERLLNLDKGHLDNDYKGNLETYYVSLSIDNQYSYEIVENLQKQSAVQECHLLLGDHDIMLKVSVANYRFLDIIISHISKLPGIKGSSSYPAVNSLSWQRSQPEKMKISKRKDDFSSVNGLDTFIHKKMNYHFSAIKELENGDIIIKRSDSVSFHSKEIIKGTKNTLLTTKYLGMKVASQIDYTDKESELIDAGVISKRIILIPDEYSEKDMVKIREEYEEYNKMGCLVKFLQSSHWRTSNSSELPEYFIIVDDSYLAIRREARKSLIVKRSKRSIDEYSEVFESNWKIGLNILELECSLT